jgi:hypothetical protein
MCGTLCVRGLQAFFPGQFANFGRAGRLSKMKSLPFGGYLTVEYHA